MSCVCLLARVHVCAHMSAPALACPHFTRVSLKQWIENCSQYQVTVLRVEQPSVALRMWLLSGCLQETEVWLLRKFFTKSIIHNDEGSD